MHGATVKYTYIFIFITYQDHATFKIEWLLFKLRLNGKRINYEIFYIFINIFVFQQLPL